MDTRETKTVKFTKRESVSVLLFNKNRELLLMYADDPKTTTMGGIYHGPYWFTVGGKIEQNESVYDAAKRETYEETGIKDIDLGPVVWHGELDLILSGKPTHIIKKFIVAETNEKDVSLNKLTPHEQMTVKKIEWFSLEAISKCTEIIYPVLLPKYISDIMNKKYPDSPLWLDLSIQPK